MRFSEDIKRVWADKILYAPSFGRFAFLAIFCYDCYSVFILDFPAGKGSLLYVKGKKASPVEITVGAFSWKGMLYYIYII